MINTRVKFDKFEVSPEYLLALLNEQTKAPAFCTIEPVDADIEAKAQGLFVATLRSLIDQWIDSGRSGTVETPKERTLRHWNERGELWKGLSSWIEEVSLRRSNSGELEFFPSLAQNLVTLTDSGELELSLPSRVITYRALPDAKNDAILHFLKLLQSSLRYRIARCSRPQCGRYFCYERVPKGILKCGTLCPDHRSHGATIRKDRQRKLRRERLLRLAANAWQKCRLDYPGDSYRWMASQVNKHLKHTEQRITRRFITQNANEIEQMAGGNHAKS